MTGHSLLISGNDKLYEFLTISIGFDYFSRIIFAIWMPNRHETPDQSKASKNQEISPHYGTSRR